MNVEIGIEATQFQEKEYINGIFLAVCVPANHWSISTIWLSILIFQAGSLALSSRHVASKTLRVTLQKNK
jgi:hypothetical protein